MSVITVTAGHSNQDPGAVNGLFREADIAQEMRNMVALYLRQKDIAVKTDGEGKGNLPLPAAIKLISEFGSVEQLLNRTDELKGKMREKVEAAVEDIKMSKFLATIRTDVPIELNLDDLKLTSPNITELEKIFTELEFKSFVNRLLNKSENKPKSVNRQLNFFEEFTPETH